MVNSSVACFSTLRYADKMAIMLLMQVQQCCFHLDSISSDPKTGGNHKGLVRIPPGQCIQCILRSIKKKNHIQRWPKSIVKEQNKQKASDVDLKNT